jgi:hypothetical protein
MFELRREEKTEPVKNEMPSTLFGLACFATAKFPL